MFVERIPRFTTNPSVDYRASLVSYLYSDEEDTIMCVRRGTTQNRYSAGSGAIAIYNSDSGYLVSNRNDFTWSPPYQTYAVEAAPEASLRFHCYVQVFQDSNRRYRFRIRIAPGILEDLDIEEPGYVKGVSETPLYEKVFTVSRQMSNCQWQISCPLILSRNDGLNYVSGLYIIWTGYQNPTADALAITGWRRQKVTAAPLAFTDLGEYNPENAINDTELKAICEKDDNILLNWSRLRTLDSVYVDGGQHGNNEMQGVWNNIISNYNVENLSSLLARMRNLGSALVSR